MLLFPDPRPLVERLGPEFFRQAPESPGVYLMRDGQGAVLYVGKAKNLKKRLAHYRVANPDRLARRHLRLLRAVERIELQPCADEGSALSRESELLRSLRPRFNRAGTWPGTRRFLVWRVTPKSLELGITPGVEPGWHFHGPMGSGAIFLRAALVRLLWSALHPSHGVARMPWGWLRGRQGAVVTIVASEISGEALETVARGLHELFAGRAEVFIQWVRDCASARNHPFELAVREADLETVAEFARRQPVSPT